jgi:hypothetical protein
MFYRGNFEGIGRMMQQPGIRLRVIRAAADMLPIAVNLSPVGDAESDPHPGLYQRSWRVEYGDKPVKFHGADRPRPYGRLVNTAGHARDVEHGTDRVPRHAVLRRTLDAAIAAHHANG